MNNNSEKNLFIYFAVYKVKNYDKLKIMKERKLGKIN